jgi:3-phosphoshikimate 1-carboxyvinyltransferase (EC 2.5.1.19)
MTAPDLAVSIASLAPFARTETVIEGVERLRIKESDRITHNNKYPEGLRGQGEIRRQPGDRAEQAEGRSDRVP